MARWVVDAEFGWSGGGEQIESRWAPILFCALRDDGQERHHFWRDDPALGRWLREHLRDEFVAHNMTAEVQYILRLRYPLPANWFCTMTGYRYVTNQKGRPPCGQADALTEIGRPDLVPAEKAGMQKRLGSFGFEWSDGEFLQQTLDYCYSDCVGCLALWKYLAPRIPADRARFWATYTLATARMELRGIPIDVANYRRIWQQRDRLCQSVRDDVNQTVPIYENGVEKRGRFFEWVDSQGIDWPYRRGKNGKMSRSWDNETMKEMECVHPFIGELRQRKKTLKSLQERGFKVDEATGLHHFTTNAFGTITGRNSPWDFMFAGPKWLRWLAVPPSPDHLLVSVDYTAQEVAIAAILANDPDMRAIYEGGDFYLGFAKAAGAAPYMATKESHANVRRVYKVTSLALLYGQSVWGLAKRLQVSKERAKEIVADHHRLFPAFWRWADRNLDRVAHHRRVQTMLGWTARVNGDGKDINTWKNYPVQGTAADQTRLTVTYFAQQGVDLRAIMHDGFLIACRKQELGDLHEAVRHACRLATDHLCPGWPIRWETKVYPTRYQDEDGAPMWHYIQDRLSEMES